MDLDRMSLEAYLDKESTNLKLKTLILDFYDSYLKALASSPHFEKNRDRFLKFIQLIIEKIKNPYAFQIFHRSVREPFDYYQFGLDFIRPFVDFQNSKISGLNSIKAIQEHIKKGENVILLANHQIEPDPQILGLFLEKIDPGLASDMIFVAGDRVISDPMAIPMSLGCNLLCIYSKKHISHPPEKKAEKVLHNQRTLNAMKELLNQGGNCIYVAPSGGRDRPNSKGQIEVAPFDSHSVELFWLMGKQAQIPTHFYPLALKTYSLMPPPIQVEKELGEKREVHITPVYLAFGEELDMENFPGSENLDKIGKRSKRAEFIWGKVCESYRQFPIYT